MIKIGLFFGSFNPFHIGHKVIGAHMVQHTDLDKVWYVVSPQNPQKEKKSLLNQHHRMQIIQREIEDHNDLDVRGFYDCKKRRIWTKKKYTNNACFWRRKRTFRKQILYRQPYIPS